MRRVLVAVLAWLVVSVCAAPGAVAAPQPMNPWYYELTGIKTLHEMGLDGAGVKIGLIDSRADLSMPELVGVKATVKTYCEVGYTAEGDVHASNVLASMAAPVWGWAPKATYQVYAMPDLEDKDLPETCRKIMFGRLLAEALNDRNDIVVMTSGAGWMVDPEFSFGLVRAGLKGVPVVIAAGNKGEGVEVPARDNFAVAVGAADKAGARWAKSGKGVELTLNAAGVDIPIRTRNSDGSWADVPVTTSGTSLSAPQVAGALALAKQKYPSANGNQLIRTLIDTTINPTPGRARDNDYGYGNLNGLKLVKTNPLTQPTTNPLNDKRPDALPDARWVAEYRDGEMARQFIDHDNDYIYRGTDPRIGAQFPPNQVQLGTSPRLKSASPTPSPSTTVSPRPTPPAPWWSSTLIVAAAVFAAVVLAGAVTFIALRRKGTR